MKAFFDSHHNFHEVKACGMEVDHERRARPDLVRRYPEHVGNDHLQLQPNVHDTLQHLISWLAPRLCVDLRLRLPSFGQPVSTMEGYRMTHLENAFATGCDSKEDSRPSRGNKTDRCQRVSAVVPSSSACRCACARASAKLV